jgi:hypothetical protein
MLPEVRWCTLVVSTGEAEEMTETMQQARNERTAMLKSASTDTLLQVTRRLVKRTDLDSAETDALAATVAELVRRGVLDL